MLADRSSSTTTRRSPAAGSVASMYGRANKKAIRARHAIRSASRSQRFSRRRRALSRSTTLRNWSVPRSTGRARWRNIRWMMIGIARAARAPSIPN